MQNKGIFLLSVFIAITGLSNAYAEDLNNTMAVRFGITNSQPTVDSVIEDVEVKVDDATGVDLGFEWFGSNPNSILGLEFGLSSLKHDIKTDGSKIGTLRQMPFSFNMNFHPYRSKGIDFYLGPSLTWMNWDDLKLSDGSKAKVERDTALGFNVGFDIGLGSSKAWAINLALRYREAQANIKDPEQLGLSTAVLNIDPYYLNIGATYRFF